MPELPDLQVFSRNLTKHLGGKKVKSVTLSNAKKIKIPKVKFENTLVGKKVSRVKRVGKELHIVFTSGDVLSLHMMLHGQLYFYEGEHDKKNSVVDIRFSDNTGLVMTDFQGAATPIINPEEKDAIDALSPELTFTFLKRALAKKRSAIKIVLLDQKVIRGIGNAYADEILWAARISPFAVANAIPDAYLKKLTKAIKTVLTKAEKSILKTHPDIISGEVRDFLQVHNAKKRTTSTGAKIQFKLVGGRKTYFTDEQQLFE
jgi:formamidopyrimidine-DNA glycosylase